MARREIARAALDTPSNPMTTRVWKCAGSCTAAVTLYLRIMLHFVSVAAVLRVRHECRDVGEGGFSAAHYAAHAAVDELHGLRRKTQRQIAAENTIGCHRRDRTQARERGKGLGSGKRVEGAGKGFRERGNGLGSGERVEEAGKWLRERGTGLGSGERV